MRSIQKKIESSLAVVAVSAALAILLNGIACSEPLSAPIAAAHPDDATPRRGGTLRLATIGDARSLDPAGPTEGVARPILEALFDGLVDYDEAGHVVPSLSSRWETADGGKTYRFFLREGVRFHDGAELTADDVRRSTERALRKSTSSPFASFYDGLLGYDEFRSGTRERLDGVVVEGRYVVSYRLKSPDATFLAALALHALRPVCKSAGGTYSDSWHPCGTGPFVLREGAWERGMHVKVVRNESYFRADLPYLDAIQWTFSMNIVTERFKFETGELDLIRDLTQSDLVRFQKDKRWRLFGEAEADNQVHGESMNTQTAPFDNIEVRRAVASAINREHYRLLGPARMSPASQVVPPMVPGHNPSIQGQTYDYAAALEHMRQAGYPYNPKTGEGGYPGRVVYTTYQQGLHEYTAQVLQQELAKIGLRIDIRVLSWPAYLAVTHKKGSSAMAPGSWQQDYPDPSDFFEPLFSSSAAENEEDSSNTAFYRNPHLDELLERARRELEPGTRQRLYDEANEIVIGDAPWAFTFYFHFFEIRQPYVRGYHPHPVWTQNVRGAWLDRAASATAAAARPLESAVGSILPRARP